MSLLAQDPTGAVTGSVLDPTGARVAGARVVLNGTQFPVKRQTFANRFGEFRFDLLPAGEYRVVANATGFVSAGSRVEVSVSGRPSIQITLFVGGGIDTIDVAGTGLETTSSVEQSSVSERELHDIPLAARSFANIAYLAPMTEPVEPSDPTKARITAVSFAGSSGLNVDLSVDGGDNNDDYIGGFLQNYSPDAIHEFTVRTAQFEADTSRTNGGSIVINTRRGSDDWHGDLATYIRASAWNARNALDNPSPDPKQPFSRENYVGSVGGPILKQKLWFFSDLEYVHENASIAYSAQSQSEFQALSGLATAGLIPGITSIPIPTIAPVPFRDTLFLTRLDWAQSDRSHWFLRGATDRYRTGNNLIQQATLPSTGATTDSKYYSVLLSNQFQFSPSWIASLTLQANGFNQQQTRNSQLGFGLAFPFSANYLTTSGFETFGDNQFVTPITAFPVYREQEKYQARYDVAHSGGTHAPHFGVNFIHEPVLSGALTGNAETLVTFPQDPSYYLAHQNQFVIDYAAGSVSTPASNGFFGQNIQRLGLYVEDSWRVRPGLTLNYGLRWDTTFGLFMAEGRSQAENPAVVALDALGIGLAPGVPHDYRKAFAPRIGLAWAPHNSTRTRLRAGFGIFYNDLAQNGWVNAFQAVDGPLSGPLGPGAQGAVIDPVYRTPYSIQASGGVEHEFGSHWTLNVFFEHQEGVHQYRRYEYISGVTLPADAPSVSVFRTDNRSRYDGMAIQVRRRFTQRFEMSAHYTLASAATWGSVVGELFDYVNGVSDVRNAFAPGDHGPSGEDVRHRFVVSGILRLPFGIEASSLMQFESARPFTIATPVDVNGDGLSTNDRAVVNGRQTTLDQFRGTPFQQVDLRVSRPFVIRDHITVRPFAEFFNLLNRTNPGNNFVASVSALPVPPDQLANVTSVCTNADCSQTRPVQLKDLRVPAGALGDFFGPGTTVGIPFAAQLGVRITF